MENEPGVHAPAPVPPPLLNEPIGVQLARRDARLAGVPFRVLLDFENRHDGAFILRTPIRAGNGRGVETLEASVINGGPAHTGRGSLEIRPTMPPVGFNLSSLVTESFPGKWTMAGGYFFSNKPATVTLGWRPGKGSRSIAARSVALAPGQWTRVMLDLTEPTGTNAATNVAGDAGLLTLAIQGEASVYCDDIILINNDFSFVDVGKTSPLPPSSLSPANSSWMIRQRGFQTVVERANAFRLVLKTPDATAEGWTCVEANALRAQFISAGGKNWTIYADGRSVQEGALGSLFKSIEPAYRQALAEQHAEPGTLEVAEEFGRVNRESKGDLHNSGYNTLRAAYFLDSAQKTRFEFRIMPGTRQIMSPTFEVAGLGKGNPVILVEGQLMDRYAWLADGRLLFEVPLAISRGTTVNISMK